MRTVLLLAASCLVAVALTPARAYAVTRTATDLTPEAVGQAIDAAEDGDTVQLPAGRIVRTKGLNNGRSTKTKAITIRGAGIDKTIIGDDRSEARDATSESSRMLALGGADIICMPIMGDLRADRFSPGPPIFNESRWKAILRTRAIDNQVCMVVARNDVQGSCIINRQGEVLAWNEGDREFTCAVLPADDDRRMRNGTELREVTFLLRRPHLYCRFTDPENLGSLRPIADGAAAADGGKR